MNQSFCLRLANATDAEQLGIIGPAIYAESYGHVWSDAEAYTEHLATFGQNASRDFLTQADTKTWLVECNSRAIGFLSMMLYAPDPIEGRTDGAKIARVYILAPARGRGLAGKLMEEADRYARSIGTDHLWLDALRETTWACRAYRALGFTNVGETIFPGDIKPEFKPMVVMRRSCRQTTGPQST